METTEPVLKNIYQRNAYRKDLSWPDFNNEARVQKKQQVKDQQSCIFVFVACQVDIPSVSGRYTLIFTVCNWVACSLDITEIYRIGKSVVLFGLT